MFGVAVVAVTVALLWPRVDVSLPSPGLPWDKAVHLLLFAGLGVLGSWARLPPLPLAGILVVQAVTTEALQGWLLPHRSADAADLVADGLGIVMGIAIGRALWRHRDRRPAPVSRR